MHAADEHLEERSTPPLESGTEASGRGTLYLLWLYVTGHPWKILFFCFIAFVVFVALDLALAPRLTPAEVRAYYPSAPKVAEEENAGLADKLPSLPEFELPDVDLLGKISNWVDEVAAEVESMIEELRSLWPAKSLREPGSNNSVSFHEPALSSPATDKVEATSFEAATPMAQEIEEQSEIAKAQSQSALPPAPVAAYEPAAQVEEPLAEENRAPKIIERFREEAPASRSRRPVRGVMVAPPPPVYRGEWVDGPVSPDERSLRRSMPPRLLKRRVRFMAQPDYYSRPIHNPGAKRVRVIKHEPGSMVTVREALTGLHYQIPPRRRSVRLPPMETVEIISDSGWPTPVTIIFE